MMTKKKAPKIQNLAHLTFTQKNGISIKIDPNRDVIFVPVDMIQIVFKTLESSTQEQTSEISGGYWLATLFIGRKP